MPLNFNAFKNDPDKFMDDAKKLLEKDTKLISVVRSDTTMLRVNKLFSIKNADDDTIRSLLTSSIPIEGHDQVDNKLLITDHNTGDQVLFDQENI